MAKCGDLRLYGILLSAAKVLMAIHRDSILKVQVQPLLAAPMSDLRIARCSRDAAKYAVLNWHYSKTMPTGRLIMYGVWEDSKYIGAVIYGRGANGRMLAPYGLTQAEGCELVRVALTTHIAPVSQIVAFTLKDVRRTNPGLRIIISYADPVQGHYGGIYQAGGWQYDGESQSSPRYLIRGKYVHNRTVSSNYKSSMGTPRGPREGETQLQWVCRTQDPNSVEVPPVSKHRYVMPLDRQMRRLLRNRVQPYPKKQVTERG